MIREKCAKRLAAVRVIQESRSMSVCAHGEALRVYPADEIPAGWFEIHRMGMDSPDLKFQVVAA